MKTLLPQFKNLRIGDTLTHIDGTIYEVMKLEDCYGGEGVKIQFKFTSASINWKSRRFTQKFGKERIFPNVIWKRGGAL